MGADSAAIFIRLGDVVGADRDQPAIANLHLTMELQQPFSLPAVFWAEAAAAEDENHGILSLQLGELPMLSRCDRKAHSPGRSPPEPCQIACEVLHSLARQQAGRPPSQINHDVARGLRAADQQVAVRRCVDRIRAVADLPATSPVSQVWQAPVRQAHRTGTSQASASSSKLWNEGPQRTLRPERANETVGPRAGGPAGTCGGRRDVAEMPGVLEGPAPNISVWMRSGATPRPVRPAVRPLMMWRARRYKNRHRAVR